ncbi:MAG: BamA/TamA family outer membrane protein [Saprospiraceae bacterium]
MIKFRSGFFFLLLGLFVASSCNVTRYLKEDEELLVKNEIKFPKGEKLEEEKELRYELTTLYRQRPNDKWMFFFRVPAWTYIKLEKTVQDTAFENSVERSLRQLFEKRLAEKPSIFNEELAKNTADNMLNFLRNRGYFDAKVEYFKENSFAINVKDGMYFDPVQDQDLIDVPEKKVAVTYYVQPNARYYIDTIAFLSTDSAVNSILQEIAPETHLTPGEPLDGRLYDQEVVRITSYLRNHGYALFTPNYVAPLDADTTGHKAKVIVEVLPPGSGKNHKVFKFGEISVAPDYNPILEESDLTDSIVNRIVFVKEKGKKFWIKPNALNNSIDMEPGQLYSQEKVDLTNRQLTKLGVFRFVNLRQQEDQNQNLDQIDFDINLSPRKKYEFGWDLGLNSTERNLANSRLNLFGVNGGLSLLNRNLFRGAESLAANGSIGLELNFDPVGGVSSLINTFDGRFQVDLYVPRFVDYLNFYRGLSKLKIIKKSFVEDLEKASPTRFSLGYNYLALANFYSYHLLNAGFGFDLQKPKHRYIINNFAVDLLLPSTDSIFNVLLESNQFLKNSFGTQMFTGFFFRDFNYIYSSKVNRFGESYYFQFRTELSGLEIFAVNKAYNAIAGAENAFEIINGVEYAQYAKAEIDARHYRSFNPKTGIAFRLNVGLGRPFGFSTDVPYVKQFFVGGPQSIRAWGARGLGPGSYFDENQQELNRLSYYQTGDFKFEVNAEYRFYLFKFLSLKGEGALFVDAGNVWTIKEDVERPGSQLQWKPKIAPDGTKIGDNFFNEFAVGTGFGLRFDFDYFLLRLDLGYPIKNPYKRTIGTEPNAKETYWAFSNLRDLNSKSINYNLGVNYPF